MGTDKTRVGYQAPTGPPAEELAEVISPPSAPPSSHPESQRRQPQASSSAARIEPASRKPSGEGDTIVIHYPDDISVSSNSPLLRFADHTPHRSTAGGLSIGSTLLNQLRRVAGKRRLAKLLQLLSGPPPLPAAPRPGEQTRLRRQLRSINGVAFLISATVGLLIGAVAIGVASRSDPAPPLDAAEPPPNTAPAPPRHVSLEVVLFPTNAVMSVDGEAMPGIRELNHPCSGPVSVEIAAPGYLTERYTFECGRPVLLIVNMRKQQDRTGEAGAGGGAP